MAVAPCASLHQAPGFHNGAEDEADSSPPVALPTNSSASPGGADLEVSIDANDQPLADMADPCSGPLDGWQSRWWARPLLPWLGVCDILSKKADADSSSSMPSTRSVREKLTDEEAAAGLKLIALVFAAIAGSRYLLCYGMGIACDMEYSLSLFLRQDMHMVCLDLVFLFLVGRLGAESPLPADSPCFIFMLFCGAVVPSLLGSLEPLQASVSIYTIACEWDVLNFLAYGIVVILVVGIVVAHLFYFCLRFDRAARARLAAEIVMVAVIFVAPRASEPAFHAHHWFLAWLLALFCRLPTSWSRATQAFLIGYYVNGIALWGRDPVLTCQTAFDLAWHARCPWFESCIDMWNMMNETESESGPTFRPPNWKTCDAGDYAH